MKRLSLIIVLAGILASCTTKQVDTSQKLKEHYSKVYSQAKSYNDLVAQSNALVNLIALGDNVEKNEDSLFFIYARLGNNSALVTLGEKLLQRKANDTLVLGTLIEAYQMLGDLEKAYEYQKKIYDLTKSPKDNYRLAILEFNMNKTAEAKKRVTELLKDKSIEGETITISTRDGFNQEVPLKAALYNALGIIYVAERNPAKAKQEFEKALKIKPDFILARNNLQTFVYGRR